jgi:hypothetical protein
LLNKLVTVYVNKHGKIVNNNKKIIKLKINIDEDKDIQLNNYSTKQN